MEVINHINIIDGEARIRGREHLKAEMVARMVVGTDYAIEDVMEQYNLSAADVHAAIAYYYDNRETLDTEHHRITSEIRENATNLERYTGQSHQIRKDCTLHLKSSENEKT